MRRAHYCCKQLLVASVSIASCLVSWRFRRFDAVMRHHNFTAAKLIERVRVRVVLIVCNTFAFPATLHVACCQWLFLFHFIGSFSLLGTCCCGFCCCCYCCSHCYLFAVIWLLACMWWHAELRVWQSGLNRFIEKCGEFFKSRQINWPKRPTVQYLLYARHI